MDVIMHRKRWGNKKGGNIYDNPRELGNLIKREIKNVHNFLKQMNNIFKYFTEKNTWKF